MNLNGPFTPKTPLKSKRRRVGKVTSCPRSAGEPASVHGEGVAVDEAAPIRVGEEGDG
jgi:hypothetical protein